MKNKFALLIMLITLCSCNTYRIANRYTAKKLHKSGLALNEFHNEKYKISYWDSGGDKPVLILIHGFGASTQFQWFKQVKALKNKYRLILPNLIYFGGSTANPQIFSVAEQVTAMQSLIDNLDVKTYSLCGISYGGLVSAELALLHPEKITKLVLCDAPVKFITMEDLQAACRRFSVNSVNELLIPKDHKQLKPLLRVAYHHPPHVPAFMLKSVYKNMYVPFAKEQNGLLNSLEKQQDIYTAKNYPFPFPVLLIWGANDQLIPVKTGQLLQKHIGNNAKLELIPGTAHMPNLEAPKTFNKVLLDFLSE